MTLLSWLVLLGACTGDDAGDADAGDAGQPPPDWSSEVAFPADFERDYLEMRDCRHSHEHELRYIRVFASPSAQMPYATLSPEEPYPVGATLVKLEHDDEACSELLGYTVMRKLSEGEQPEGGDWMWQRVSAERELLEAGAPVRCLNCHEVHCAPPYGYDLSCAEEL